MFKITSGKGFHMTFKNGYTISVQFGPGNYCDNQNLDWDSRIEPSNTAEIAIWLEGEDLIEFPHGDTVKGWCTPDEVAQFISEVKNWEPGKINKFPE